MAVMDYIQSTFEKVLRPRRGALSGRGNGIGNMGAAQFEDDMIISKPAIIFYSSQAFLNFLAMCCFASVASFQAKWDVGPSGLSGFAIFVSVAVMFLSLFMLFVPVIDAKYNKLSRLARALTEMRVAFILTATGTILDLLIAFIVTISAWTEEGCKNASDDPHASLGDDFQNGLSGWCSTKKAAAIFFWFAFGSWCGTLTLNIMNWRSGKARIPRDPPFHPPASEAGIYDELEEDDEESTLGGPAPLRQNTAHHESPFSDNAAANRNSQALSYTLPPVGGVGSFASPGVSSAAGSMPAARASMDAYGAFSDPAPSGYGAPPPAQQQSFGSASGLSGSTSPSGVSRTMQYADPYAAVRASIAGGPTSSTYSTAPPSQGPPSYTEYTGYR